MIDIPAACTRPMIGRRKSPSGSTRYGFSLISGTSIA
jgi:hypothetical protein